jgi:hypothetical protein
VLNISQGVGSNVAGYIPNKRLGGAVSGVTKGVGDTVTGVTGGKFVQVALYNHRC